MVLMAGPLVSPVQLVRRSGEPIAVGDVALTPESRALVVRLPFAGLVWHWPTAVIVERGGRRERVRVWDVTRVIALALLAMAGGAVAYASARRRNDAGGQFGGPR